MSPPAATPVPPNPADFGIEAGYWDKAAEGARAWKKRRKLIPDFAQMFIFLLFAVPGIALSVCAAAPELKAIRSVAGFGCIVGIALGYGLGIGVQQLHDAYLLRTRFKLLYDPDPSGYASYAKALADYESEVFDVHLTATGRCFHSSKHCSGTLYETVQMPKYKARAHYPPCSHCGHFTIGPKLLPRPFGKGWLPIEKP